MTLKIPTLVCNRCGHRWFPRAVSLPKRCAACNSPYWNRPRKYKLGKN